MALTRTTIPEHPGEPDPESLPVSPAGHVRDLWGSAMSRFARRPGATLGFTLIELVVVVVVLAIIAAIAVPSFLSQRRNGYDARISADLRSTAQELRTHDVDREAFESAFGETSTAAHIKGVDAPAIEGSTPSWNGATSTYLPRVKVSEGTYIEVSVPDPIHPGVTDFCLAGASTRSNYSPTSPGQYDQMLYFDSTLGTVVPFDRLVSTWAKGTQTACTSRVDAFNNPGGGELEGGSVGALRDRTNLATNPSFETGSGTVDVATNHATDPRFISRGYVGAGTGVITRNPGGGVTLTNSSDSQFRMDFQWTVPASGAVTITVETDADPGSLSVWKGDWTNPPTSVSEKVGSRIRKVFTGLESGDLLHIGLRPGMTSGATATFDRIFISPGNVPGTYFDGSTKPALRTNFGAGAASMGSAAPNATSNITLTGSTDKDGVRSRKALFGARSGASATAGWQRWMQSVGTSAASPSRVFQGRKITFETVVVADRDSEVRFFSQQANSNYDPAAPSGNLHSDAYSGWFALKAGVPQSVKWTWTPTVAKPGNTGFNAGAGLELRNGLSDTSDGTVITYREFDVYEGDYNPAREFLAPGQSDSTGLVAQWSGTANASPVVVVDPDFTVAWTGAANASSSVLQGIGLDNVYNYGGARAIRSSRWSSTGEYSARPVPASSDSYVQIGNYYGAFTSRFVPGRTYRVSATLHLFEAQTGASQAFARTIYTQNTTPSRSTPAPNEPGTHRVTFTFRVNDDATTGFLRLGNGSASFSDMWWDDLMIEDVTDGVPVDVTYFDGSTPGTRRAIHRWTGPPHASTSTAIAW